ncbi:unnamed protein product [Closterium sp. NIES-64]|nr:unnamed protein product [Closterium sp. NIES-64]
MVVPINPHLSNPPSPYFLLLYLRRRVRCVDSQWCKDAEITVPIVPHTPSPTPSPLSTLLSPPPQGALRGQQWCKDAEITVPITDFCPGGGVCCATCTHFDLSQPAFGIIADPVAGVIPLAYQRVPCSFPTSITFRVTGTNYWMNVLLLRVGGPGEVALVEVSSKNDPNWRPLTHDWGTNWVSWSYIEGPLKFRLTSGMDGAVITTGENAFQRFILGITLAARSLRVGSQTTGGVTIPNASYSIDSNGGAATSSNAQVGAGGTAAAGAVGAGNPVTAGRVKRGKKWRTEAAPPKKPGGATLQGRGTELRVKGIM